MTRSLALHRVRISDLTAAEAAGQTLRNPETLRNPKGDEEAPRPAQPDSLAATATLNPIFNIDYIDPEQRGVTDELISISHAPPVATLNNAPHPEGGRYSVTVDDIGAENIVLKENLAHTESKASLGSLRSEISQNETASGAGQFVEEPKVVDLGSNHGLLPTDRPDQQVTQPFPDVPDARFSDNAFRAVKPCITGRMKLCIAGIIVSQASRDALYNWFLL